MGEAYGGAMVPMAPAASTVLVSQRRGMHPFIVIILGACAAFGLFAMAVSVIYLGKLGTARVVGPADEPGRTRVVVLDGPDPKAWIIPSDEVGDARPGEVIDVRLGGECDCEPYPAVGDPGSVLFLGVFLLVLFVPSLVNYLRNRKGQVAQARAARVLTADAPVTPVLLVPSIHWVRKKPTVRARVFSAAGLDLGELDLGRVRPAFDPTLRWWLVGPPEVGATVALVSEHRRQVVLPSSPLRVPTEAPSWSPTAVTRLGWDAPAAAPEQVLVLPSEGRVAVPPVPVAGGSAAVSPERRAQTAAVQRTARIQLVAALAAVVVMIIAVNVLRLPPMLGFVLIVGTGVVVGRVMNRKVKAAASGTLELVPADQPYALQIATSLASWQNKAVKAPAFHRTLPIGAV